MLVDVNGVLDATSLAAARQLLAETTFVDGRASAGTAAGRVKNNQEVRAEAPEISRLNHIVMGNLVAHPVYKSAVLPARVAVPFYVRYGPGMAYGDHVDDPVMGPESGRYRSDVAITVFLSEPDSYAGGELVIRTSFGTESVKLAAGDAVLYPASSLHRVNTVTEGERLVAVTWAQSLVRDPAQRELLYELDQARESLLRSAPDSPEAARVNRVYVNLVRRWSEV